MAQCFLIEQVRIFDGAQVLPSGSVLIEGGSIVAVGERLAAPAGAEIITGTGCTLLPGLIDAHTHVLAPASLKQALIFGVTTELDMFMDYRMAHALKEQQQAGQGKDMADLRSAGTLATAPGGHGTEFGVIIPTITDPAEAQAFVDARLAEGSDYIKIAYDNGSAHGRPLETISKATLIALVRAARERRKLSLVHALTHREACDAIEAGCNGLAHLFVDPVPANSDFGRFVAEHGAFVIPTLATLLGACGTPSGLALLNDPALSAFLSQEDRHQLQQAFPLAPGLHHDYTGVEQTVRQLKAAGVPILAGTDAPSPGTLHGASLHRELELLVQAGLTPIEALQAATSLPAALFSLHDRGRIAPGLRADLVLVEGDPTSEICATRRIVRVWKQGVVVERTAYAALLAQRRAEAAGRLPPAGSESGLVSDFEDGTLGVHFGAGWQALTDQVRGGTSTVELAVIPEGVNGGKGSLQIRGNVAPGIFAWSGAVFFPGAQPWSPANLSHKQALSFWAKGDGNTYRVLVFSGDRSSLPVTFNFHAGQEWHYYRFPLGEEGIDIESLLAVLFAAGPLPCAFECQIDDVRFE